MLERFQSWYTHHGVILSKRASARAAKDLGAPIRAAQPAVAGRAMKRERRASLLTYLCWGYSYFETALAPRTLRSIGVPRTIRTVNPLDAGELTAYHWINLIGARVVAILTPHLIRRALILY
jgi:hypothetical protein